MSLDVLFFAWNRREFTEATFPLLLANTAWEHVDRLIVYDDGSSDGTREYLDTAIADAPVEASLCHVGWGSPVKTMNLYLERERADVFAKIDSDIAVPPGWLEAMLGVLDRNQDLELLGMAAGFGVPLPDGFDGVYGYEPSSHIGGVGVMRSSAFTSREPMGANGRFGFTSWQQHWNPVRGWISPELYVPQLDLLPVDPWRSLSRRYIRKQWQREWPPYAEESRRYWEWFTESSKVGLGDAR